MERSSIDSQRVYKQDPLAPPSLLAFEIPMTETATLTVQHSRKQIQAILDGHDDRFIVLLTPTSDSFPFPLSQDYTELKSLCSAFSKDLLIVLYSELDYLAVPHSNTGIHSTTDDVTTCNINKSLHALRQHFHKASSSGIPIACDVNDNIAHNYFDDLLSLGISNSKLASSQSHTALVSGLPFPVAFSVNKSDDLLPTLQAIDSASSGHQYLGISQEGLIAISKSRGNSYGFVKLNSNEHEHPEFYGTLPGMKNKTGRPKVLLDCAAHGVACVRSEMARGDKLVIGTTMKFSINGSCKGEATESKLKPQDVYKQLVCKLNDLRLLANFQCTQLGP
ncbi:putative 3-deoxy-D-arabino-heptulosonate 7-phosphate (DAHP) synthase isoenzyme [Fusarium proliferatum ET1]|uniref:3-deoxy-7-phosphoheptulonate synthase n=1 Tax=Fusarium proliferatum (strain ET1) TaxID=1227346 RepID=A0A1L7W5K5_FUSPR|nr:putative 3-deoxy-D-arabino-heptulosonate 7-phosphate (DAHP) synthase isoenzyme [Fusarium proliferatum ET1]CZR47904.1 probable 3-deoxy-D-arabino-heptulosonate 7-phosphate (DAHP) synthase isoenzyme [Fusarium proliferatum ET1]